MGDIGALETVDAAGPIHALLLRNQLTIAVLGKEPKSLDPIGLLHKIVFHDFDRNFFVDILLFVLDFTLLIFCHLVFQALQNLKHTLKQILLMLIIFGYQIEHHEFAIGFLHILNMAQAEFVGQLGLSVDLDT